MHRVRLHARSTTYRFSREPLSGDFRPMYFMPSYQVQVLLMSELQLPEVSCLNAKAKEQRSIVCRQAKNGRILEFMFVTYRPGVSA